MRYQTYLLAILLGSSITLAGCGNSFVAGTPTQPWSVATQNQMAVAKRITRLPASLWPQEIAFVTRDLGYLSGTIPFHGSTIAQLYKTTDGGRTWTLVFLGGVSISSLAALGRYVWIDVAKTSSYPTKSELFASTTGGKSFQPISSKSLTNMAFTSVDTGWGVSSSNGPRTVVITKNGGRVWKPVASVPTFESALGEPQSLSFSDTRHGLLLETGEPSAGQEPKVLLRTTNGGQSWVTISNSESGVHSLGSGGYTDGIAVAPGAPDDAWIWQTYGPLLHTSDGGTHWTDVDTISRLDLRSGLNQVLWMSFVSPLIGYALLHHNFTGGASTLMETKNGGKTWITVSTW